MLLTYLLHTRKYLTRSRNREQFQILIILLLKSSQHSITTERILLSNKAQVIKFLVWDFCIPTSVSTLVWIHLEMFATRPYFDRNIQNSNIYFCEKIFIGIFGHPLCDLKKQGKCGNQNDFLPCLGSDVLLQFWYPQNL